MNEGNIHIYKVKYRKGVLIYKSDFPNLFFRSDKHTIRILITQTIVYQQNL